MRALVWLLAVFAAAAVLAVGARLDQGYVQFAWSQWRVEMSLLMFGVLALAAACLNPYGPQAILVTFHTVALGQALLVITEWRPQDFSHLGPFELITPR